MLLYSFTYCLPYLIALSLLCAAWLLPDRAGALNCGRSLSVSKTVVSALVILVFFGLRGAIHSDWHVYYTVFQKMPSIFEIRDVETLSRQSGGMETGFLCFLSLFKSINNNYFAFQSFLFIIDFLILYYTCTFYIGQKYIAAFFLFYFLFGMLIQINLLRNIKSILLFIVSIRFIEERKFLPFVLLNMLGLLFHTSAVIYLPFYFILSHRFQRKTVLMLFCIGLIIFVCQLEWLKTAITFLADTFFSSTQFRLIRLASHYLNSDFFAKARLFTVGNIERIISFFLVLACEPKIRGYSKYMIVFINMFYFYVFCYLYFYEMVVFVERVGTLFVLSYCFLFPVLYKTLSKKYKPYFPACFILYAIMKMIYGNISAASEYHFLWMSEAEMKQQQRNERAILRIIEK